MNEGSVNSDSVNSGSGNEGSGSVEAPFGSWSSPLTARAVASGSPRFGELAHIGSDVIWAESRPGYDRSGVVFVSQPDTAMNQELLLGAKISARTRVNEYGGGAFWVHGDPRSDGRIYWVDAASECLLWAGADAYARELLLWPLVSSEGAPSVRYASGVATPDGNWVICERESQKTTPGTGTEATADGVANAVLADAVLADAVLADAVLADGAVANELVAIRTAPAPPVVIVGEGQPGSGDFTAAPTLSPDGLSLAWLRWDHPDMPWDAAELWAADVHYGGRKSIAITQPRRVAGGLAGGQARGLTRAVSVSLPKWSPDGHLWWCDDSTDWWHLYRSAVPGTPEAASGDHLEPLIADAQEEVGEPRWVAGGCRYGFTSDGTVVFAAKAGGFDSLWSYDPATSQRLPLPGPGFTCIDSVSVEGSSVAVIAGLADQPSSVWHIDLASGVATDLRATPEVAPPSAAGSAVAAPVAAPGAAPLGADWVSTPMAITFPTGSQEDGLVQAHALFYPPQSPRFHGPEGESPPLLVRIHGGPTASARAEFSPSLLFWTSRGFAVADVNYRGSTGFGRQYRDQLRGEWGVADVQDCIAAARFLAEQGLVDPGRCVIRGGSAGGFTALAALCFQQAWGFDGTFVAACSLYGVTDLAALAADTHKFESRYLDGLVGSLPEQAATYRARSPLFHAEHLSRPVLLLQGADDKVVPPAQAEVLVTALQQNQVPHAYVLFQGEGHGFLLRETVVNALETELAFYGEVLGFQPDGNPPQVEKLVGWPAAPSSGRMGA